MLSTVGELCQKLVKSGKSYSYPLIDRVFRLVLTLPVSTATTERAFSAMKIIKTRLRNKMEDDFLKDYMIVYIEDEIAEKFTSYEIVDEFKCNIVSKLSSKIMVEPTQRYAVVTGSNKGIGFEIVRQLASAGIKVVLTARDEKRGLQALETLKYFGLSDFVVFHQLDVADAASVASLADFVKSQFGKLDILMKYELSDLNRSAIWDHEKCRKL
ncbi:hypothetical protein TSUD_362230 [Trifolium subterraneum]|uniref:HAT C-terminal dimerisation domain-containing protein n=1 Tax=Trifolium subterraneum TaxID=3900 RepID=A0A2Z6MHC1_TRISU|nr:hypothetical protein TSUD_362230 [Trifolium subterraneum]